MSEKCAVRWVCMCKTTLKRSFSKLSSQLEMRKTLTDFIQAEFRSLKAQAEALHGQIQTRSWAFSRTSPRTTPSPTQRLVVYLHRITSTPRCLESQRAENQRAEQRFYTKAEATQSPVTAYHLNLSPVLLPFICPGGWERYGSSERTNQTQGSLPGTPNQTRPNKVSEHESF